jgi:predicted alpha/beta hydrolase
MATFKTLQSNENEIVATIYEPETTPKFAVILSCPTGTKQSYFQKFSEYLCSKGILVVTYDYSGIGKSAPKKMKGYQTSVSTWAKHDLTTVIDYVSENYSYQKLILMGLSIGGQIVGLTPSIRKVDALINVAAQSGYWALWPFPIKFVLFFNWYFLQILTRLFGYFPGKKLGLMEDLPKGVAIEWARWGLKKDYLFDFIPEATAQFSAIQLPLLAYSFSDDRTAPKITVDEMTAKFANGLVTRKHIQPSELNLKEIGHFGFFRSGCKPLWDETIIWLENVA